MGSKSFSFNFFGGSFELSCDESDDTVSNLLV